MTLYINHVTVVPENYENDDNKDEDNYNHE